LYANAVMGTLVALGFVARGRTAAGWCFRLTPLGRAVFGAPDVAVPPEPAGEPFLIVQPNFDVVGYLDRATAAAAAMLGALTEAGAANAGLVQTCKLTQQSVYQVQEGGVTLAEVTEFLRRHQRGELPANVLQTLATWSARREALVLTRSVTLLAFPTAAERDAYQAGHPGAACGERFLVVREDVAPPAGGLVIDHATGGRRTLTLDEGGWLHAAEPYDLLQRQRLRRIAAPVEERWRLSGDSVRRATAAGDGASLWRWLDEMLREPMPILFIYAIGAWQGEPPDMAMAEAVLLHVPDGDAADALTESPRLRPFLQGRIGRRWLVVRREARDALAAVLAELGFAVGRDLRFKTLEGFDRGGEKE
jgi:hypothetical protein